MDKNMHDQKFDITKYGAIGDGKTKNTESIQQAIDSCNKAGGGIVYFPPGNYLSGTVFLKDNVTLYLESGATLFGSTEKEDYIKKYLVYAEKVENIGIAGSGIIDGQGDSFWILENIVFPKTHYGVRGYRPRGMIHFINCRNVQMQDVTLKNSPCFTLWPLGCDIVNIRGITILNNLKGPNTDGIDIDCCSDVHISDCYIYAGDDCIALKSDTKRLGSQRACENITVTNCTFVTNCCGIRVGYEGDGPIRNCIFSNIAMHNTRTGINMIATRNPNTRFENEEVRIEDGPAIENIVFSNIIMDVKKAIFLWVGQEVPGPQKGFIKNVLITDIITTAERACYIGGLAENTIQGVTLNNIKITMRGEMDNEFSAAVPYPYRLWGYWEKRGLPYGFYCRHVQGLKFHNVSVDWKGASGAWSSALRCENVENLELDGFTGRQGQVDSKLPAIHLSEVKGAFIHGCQAPLSTEIFLQLDGKGTKNISITGNDTLQAKKTVIIADGVNKDAVKIF